MLMVAAEGTQRTTAEQRVITLVKENAKELCHIMKSLQFREHGTVHFSRNGMRVIVEDHAYQQAVAYLEQSVFKSFDLKEDCAFRIPLQDVTEVLSMMEGDGYSVTWRYDGYGHPLSMILTAAENEYTVEARIHTMESDEMIDFAEMFNANDVRLVAVLKPDVLKDVIKATDDSAQFVTIRAKPVDGENDAESGSKVSIITNCEVGKITTTFRNSSIHVERMDVTEPISFTYNYRLIKRFAYALGVSRTVGLRIDTRGTLCAQFLLDRDKNEQIFIEFYCIPSLDDE